jgi:hypothetical protein
MDFRFCGHNPHECCNDRYEDQKATSYVFHLAAPRWSVIYPPSTGELLNPSSFSATDCSRGNFEVVQEAS